MTIDIHRSKNPHTQVKIYAKVKSRSTAETHTVVYVRTSKTRRWLCTCQDFLMRRFGVNRNCEHIKTIRRKYGRFGTKVR